MQDLTTFHLTKKAYLAIFDKKMRSVMVLSRSDTTKNEIARFVCDDLKLGFQAKITEVSRFSRGDTMIVIFDEIENVDYDFCN